MRELFAMLRPQRVVRGAGLLLAAAAFLLSICEAGGAEERCVPLPVHGRGPWPDDPGSSGAAAIEATLAACSGGGEVGAAAAQRAYALGTALYHKRDGSGAVAALQLGLDSAHGPSLTLMGHLYVQQLLPAEDPIAAAARWYELASEANDPAGQQMLGSLLVEGSSDLPADPDRAAKLWAEAADQGWGPAQLLDGERAFAARDFALARQRLEPVAAGGVPQALYLLGRIYGLGLGIEADGERAVELLGRALAAGHMAAAELLGWMWENGWELAERRQAALRTELTELQERFAEALADPGAAEQLERADLERLNQLIGELMTRQDPARAAEYYRQAAETGLVFSARRLGGLYLTGTGVSPDPARAAHWYERGAAAGDAPSAHVLATLLELGLGVATDPAHAATLRSAAAGEGELRAQIALDRNALGLAWDPEARELAALGTDLVGGAAPNAARGRAFAAEMHGASGRTLRSLAWKLDVSIEDRTGRRLYGALLAEGDILHLPATSDEAIAVRIHWWNRAEGEVDLSVSTPGPTSSGGSQRLAMLVEPNGQVRDIEAAPGVHELVVSLSAIGGDDAPTPSSSLSLEVEGGAPHALHLFDREWRVSLPTDWNPLSRYRAPEHEGLLPLAVPPGLPGLLADITGGARLRVRFQERLLLAVRVPEGAVLRLDLDALRRAGSAVEGPQPALAAGPVDVSPEPSAGSPWLYGPDGAPVGWLRTAERWEIEGVVAGFLPVNVTLAVINRMLGNRWQEAYAAGAIDLCLIRHRRGPDHPETLQAGLRLAAAELALGRTIDAETRLGDIFLRAERLLGPLSDTYASAAAQLSDVHAAAGRLALAESFARRALAIESQLLERVSDLGPISTEPMLQIGQFGIPTAAPERETLNLLGRLGDLYAGGGRLERALRYWHRWLQLHELVDPNDEGNDAVDVQLAVARGYALLGHGNKAKPLLTLAHPKAKADAGARDLPEPLRAVPDLRFAEPVFGPMEQSPMAATVLRRLGDVYLSLGRPAEAAPLFRRAREITERLYGEGGEATAALLVRLAETARDMGDKGEWARIAEVASAIYAGQAGGAEAERAFALSMEAVFEAAGGSLVEEEKGHADLLEAALTIIDQAGRDELAAAVREMVVRLAQGEGPLAAALRQRVALASDLARSERLLAFSVGQSPWKRDLVREQQLRADLDRRRTELRSLDERLGREVPEFRRLLEPVPLNLMAVRDRLEEGEVLVVLRPLERGTAVIAMSRHTGRAYLASLSATALDAEIRRLRAQLDLANLKERGRTIPEAALLAFDLEAAHRLYVTLFEPLRDMLGESQLLIAAYGSLRSLPLEVLVTEPPPPVQRLADFRRIAWLGVRHATLYLPSLGALRSLRGDLPASRASLNFVGVGDPLLPDHPALRPPSWLEQAGAAIGEAWEQTRDRLVLPFRGATLRALPDTATELSTLAASLGGGRVLLREEATETAVRESADLRLARVIAFATHGVIAEGDFAELAEPALVLSPPSASGTSAEDGFLTASEIASLNLDADLAILSACDTAAADGSLGTYGFSGLTKAFVQAGVRNLLVTHWKVDSRVSVRMSTETVDAWRSGLPLIEARQRAALSMLGPEAVDFYAHPAFWGAFVLVGAGDTARM